MSDGPYRSLPLSRRWKKVAECAENDSFTEAQISDALPAALASDWRAGDLPELVAAIEVVLDDRQASLFDRSDQLEALAGTSAGVGLRQVLVHCALQRVHAGEAGALALDRAVADALAVWAARHTRPIEEHYRRAWGGGAAAVVRARIEAGFAGVGYDAVARQLLGREPRGTIRAAPKQTGLHDGPSIAPLRSVRI